MPQHEGDDERHGAVLEVEVEGVAFGCEAHESDRRIEAHFNGDIVEGYEAPVFQRANGEARFAARLSPNRGQVWESSARMRADSE